MTCEMAADLWRARFGMGWGQSDDAFWSRLTTKLCIYQRLEQHYPAGSNRAVYKLKEETNGHTD